MGHLGPLVAGNGESVLGVYEQRTVTRTVLRFMFAKGTLDTKNASSVHANGTYKGRPKKPDGSPYTY